MSNTINQVSDKFAVQPAKEYTVLRPFGCNIIKKQMYPELIEAMCDVFQKQSDSGPISVEEDASYQLAGNMKREFHLTESLLGDKISLLTDQLTDIAAQMYVSTLQTDWNFKKDIVTPKHKEIIENNMKNNALNVQIHEAWGNISVAGDFNPPHVHTGGMSGVGYFRMPDDIEEEWLLEDHDPSAGLINFWDGRFAPMSMTNFKVKPRVGDIYIFPAWLSHSVHPFRSKGERWSFSFNLSVQNMNNDTKLTNLQKVELRLERKKLIKDMKSAS
jgi:hypothetical protein